MGATRSGWAVSLLVAAVLGAGSICSKALRAEPAEKAVDPGVTLEVPARADLKIEAAQVQRHPVAGEKSPVLDLEAPAAVTAPTGIVLRSTHATMRMTGDGKSSPYLIRVLPDAH